jgi:hypothetical protein
MKYGFVILLLLAQAAQADVYKSINADGEVVFSDVPGEGAERVRLPEVTTYKPPPPKRSSASTPDRSADAAAPYNSFKVSKPEDGATIWDNEGIVTLALALEPALLIDSGHMIQFFLDGKPDGKPEIGLSHTYRDIERGTHTLSAAVVGVEGSTVISAGPVTIHLHKASVLHPNNPLNPANKPPPTPAN